MHKNYTEVLKGDNMTVAFDFECNQKNEESEWLGHHPEYVLYESISRTAGPKQKRKTAVFMKRSCSLMVTKVTSRKRWA